MDRKPIRRALISVYDKTGLLELGKFLTDNGVEILSTGSTAKKLADAGVKVTPVESYTGSPEMLDGRVKTLHPTIHGGILADQSNQDHLEQLKTHDIAPFDLIVINLYPFTETIASGASYEECVEQIDIGGPSMLRGAAKNHKSVAVISDPKQYEDLKTAVSEGGFTFEQRSKLAMETFRKTAEYDAAIADWLGGELDANDWRAVIWEKITDLRYGENPHQNAAFYVEANAKEASVSTAKQLQGKELSYNNIADTDAALECVKSFDMPACVIVKHANPCGVAVDADLTNAYQKAFATDPESAFGGIIAFNRELDIKTAKAIVDQQFVEVIIAPSVADGVLDVTSAKKNVRVLVCGELPNPSERQAQFDFKRVTGGLLVQEQDLGLITLDDLKVVTKVQPTQQQFDDLLFTWQVAKYVKSNAIVYAKDGRTIGVGAGQMSRVNSARIAAIKAEHAGLSPVGAVMASDAFFPFRDGLDAVAAAGVRAVVQPGGSVRDEEVIAACDRYGISMVFTGMRHFRH